MKNLDIANEWFKIAENDLESARFLLNMKPQPFEIICCHCQQCAEKYLKRFIALNGGEVSKTHDLVMLNKTCMAYNGNFKKIENECIELTDYGVQMRYPFHFEVEEYEAHKAIENTQMIIELIKKEIILK